MLYNNSEFPVVYISIWPAALFMLLPWKLEENFKLQRAKEIDE